MTTDYKLIHETHGYYLKRNNIVLVCPLTPEHNECGSWCPHFDLTESDHSFNVRLFCTHNVRAIVIEKEEVEKESDY